MSDFSRISSATKASRHCERVTLVIVILVGTGKVRYMNALYVVLVYHPASAFLPLTTTSRGGEKRTV